MEELGVLFKSDPTFDYLFTKMPKAHFFKIIELRRKRYTTEPQLD